MRNSRIGVNKLVARIGPDKFIMALEVYLLRHAKFIVSATCVISIIIHAPVVSCTPKQIDLQVFFVTTVAADVNRQLLNTNPFVIIWHLHKVF